MGIAVPSEGCISGGAMPITLPLPQPMLFNLAVDPTEHDDVAAANPTVVARLTAALNAMRLTAVTKKDVLNCTGTGKKTVPAGTFVIPNCKIVG